MKLPEEVIEYCKKKLVMRSTTTGRAHNGERFSRSMEEYNEFIKDAIIDTATGSLYRPSCGALYVKGDGKTYFDVYSLVGCSVFTAYKAYRPGKAHLVLGTRRSAELLRKEKIRGKAEEMYVPYSDEMMIGVRIFKDRTFVPLFLDKDENVVTRVWNPGETTNKFYPVEDAFKDKKLRRKGKGNVPSFLSESPDIRKGILYALGRGCSTYFDDATVKIVKEIFPPNDPYVVEFARKSGGDKGCTIKTNVHLVELLESSLRLRSASAENTIKDIREIAAAEFEKARYIRRRLSSQFVLLSKHDDWIIALMRHYAIHKYDTYAVNTKTGKHYALNSDGSPMPFVMSRLDGNRVLLNGKDEDLGDSQLSKIIKSNPPQIDRREAEIAGVIIVSMDPCVLNAISKSGGNYIEQALTLNLNNIAGCLLNRSITTMDKAAIDANKKRMLERYTNGGWYSRTAGFGDAIWTILSDRTSLTKAFDLPMAKIRLIEELIDKNTKKESRGNEGCSIRMNDVMSLFQDVNYASLDDETFKGVVNISAAREGRNGGGSLADVWRELPDNMKAAGSGLNLLRKLSAYGEDFGTYKDYLRMRREVGNLPNNALDEEAFELFPQKERVAALHDRLVRKKTEFENMGRAERLKVMNQAYENGPYKKAKKVDWEGEESDKYIIVATKKLEELDVESNTLHHCVSSYKDSVMQGVEYIVFLRKKDNPDVPFITMDIDPSWKVRQIHGKYNSDVDSMPDGKEIMDFLNRWADAKQFIKKDSLSGHYGALCHM